MCFNCAEAFDQYKTVAGYRTSQAQARTWKRSTRITLTLPHDLTAAIAKWRMLQPGRPKRATAILELIAACLSATPDHPRCPDRDAGRNRKAPPEGRPVDAFGVKVVRVDRENAPAPGARAAMGLPRSKVCWVNDRFITDR